MLFFRKIASRLPSRWQIELKRIHYSRKIKNGTFVTDEPEYKLLHNFINPGDWVIDIGANVGHYTKRFSELVGAGGRVIAFEPVPVTFSILSANAQLFTSPNVSLFNVAMSDKLDTVGMLIPKFTTGLANYYEAHLEPDIACGISVLTMPLDSLCIGQHQIVTLVKIDAEGHEALVLEGMQQLLVQHRPVLIVETSSTEVIDNLLSLGYTSEKLHGSPNILFRPLKIVS